MGLLDFDMSTPQGQGFNNALLAAAQALLTPRSRGGGMGAAFGAFPQAIDRAKANAMREQLMALQEQQMGMQGQKLGFEMDEALRKAAQQQTAQARFDQLLGQLPEAERATAELVGPSYFEPKTLAPGASLVSGGRTIAQAPNKPEAKPELVRLLDMLYPEGHPRRAAYMEKYLNKQTTHAPGTKVEVNMGQKGFENTRAMRNDFNTLPTVKAFDEMRGTADIIKGALSSPSPANDMAAATKFMKMLDPGSVVRESELGMAMSATGLLDKALNYANMVANGHKLTPAQRKDFYDSTNRIMGAATVRYNAVAEKFRKEAAKWELDPDSVAEPAAMPPSVDDLVKQYGG